MSILLIIIISYLIGSIQSGILIGKIIYKTDVRQFGSKSSGATNIQITIVLKPGIFVLVLDILKGFLPILFIGTKMGTKVKTLRTVHYSL